MELTEILDVGMLGEYASHEDIWKDYRPRLQKLLAKMGNTGSLTVKYTRKDGGRFYGNQPISATTMWGEIRSGIYGHRDIDVDIVNCHPAILLQLMRKRLSADDDILSMLTEYIADRKGCLKKQSLPYKWAKSLVIGVMNGLNIHSLRDSAWAESRENEAFFDQHPNWCPCEWWKQLHSDCDAMRSLLSTQTDVKTLAEEYGWTNSVAMYLQHVETEHMLLVKAELERRGVIWSAYCYDGFQTPKTNLPVINRWIAEGCPSESPWALDFIVKPWKKMLRRNPYLFNWDKFRGLCHWRAVDDPSLEELCKLKSRAKEYWEAHWFFLDTGSLVNQTGRDTYVQYPANGNNIARLRGIKIPYLDDKNKLKHRPWLQYWIDAGPLSYPSFKYEPPYAAVDPTKVNYKERWCGWEIEKVMPSLCSPSTRMIHDHYHFLGEDCDEGYNYLIGLAAHYVQFPGKPTGICPIIIGEQGAGKSGFIEALFEQIMGKDKILAPEKAEDIITRFHQRALKHLVLADEVCGVDTHGKAADVWKHIITETVTSAEKKGIDTVQYNAVGNFMMFTNSKGNTISLERGNRRYVVFKTKSVREKPYYDALFRALENKNVVRAFYDELMAMDLSTFNCKNLYKGESYEILEQANESKIDVWLDEFRSDRKLESKAEWTTGELYDLFADYCQTVLSVSTDRTLPFASFSTQLGQTTVREGIPGFTRTQFRRPGMRKRLRGYKITEPFVRTEIPTDEEDSAE
tara:strand:- start:1684 stop:3912 length:2229 start_codon:yes stop_codon:yes gene_type:complete